MKQILRKEIVYLKKQLGEEELRSQSSQIFQNLIQSSAFKNSKCILAYHSFKKEVYTHDFIEEYAQKKKILLPVVKADNLILREYQGKDQLRMSGYGILEPTGSDFTDYAQIDLAIIPGVAFDRHLNRMGRGKGYYDKLLPHINKAYLIGICFSFQLKDKIPVESHDYKMNCVISPTEIIL